MNSAALNWILWPATGVAVGLLASVGFCSVQGYESGAKATANVLVFGRVIHEETGQSGKGLTDHVASRWGIALNAAFSSLGCFAGAAIAALVNRITRRPAIHPRQEGVQPKRPLARAAAAITRPECILAAVASVTFPLALVLPFFTLTPSFGDILADAFLEYLFPASFDSKTYSVLGGIARLFEDGDTIIALVLLLFSVFFPAVKLALIWGVLFRSQPAQLPLIRRLENLGPWSMADVFVVSVLVVAFKGFPGGTTFAIRPGYYVFLVSVIAGLLATWLAKRRIERKEANP